VTEFPGDGLALIRLPTGTVGLFTVVTEPTTRPAPFNIAAAAFCSKPTTFGTVTCAAGCEGLAAFAGETAAGPAETCRSTREFGVTELPGDGLALITLPTGTVGLFAVVTEPTNRPAPFNIDSAAFCSKLTTFGTVTVVESAIYDPVEPLKDAIIHVVAFMARLL
jgi:hypothetical protein